MKARSVLLIVIVLMVFLFCILMSLRTAIPGECPWRFSERCQTSFSRIAANPERYVGRYLFTYGYVAVSDGNVYLYRNEASYRDGDYFDRILINLSTIKKMDEVERSLYVYTSVSGVMYADVVGKEGPAIGGFDEVSIFEPDVRVTKREGWGDVGIPVGRIGPDGNPR